MNENRNLTSPSHVEQGSSLALFENAKRALSAALADAKRVDEVMGVRIRVQHLALEARRAKDRDLIADAMELQLLGERKLGEMLIVAKETGQLSKGGRPRKGETPADGEGVLDKATLLDAGVSYKLSVKAQKLAEFDEDRFADVLAAARAKIKAGGAVVVNPIKDLKTADKAVLRAVKEAQLALRQKALPAGQFGVIYADPEWQFETYSAAGLDRSADNHYPTSTLEVIAARPVQEIAAGDCVLFLWVTAPHHAAGNGAMVMRAWGFEPKAEIVWDKIEVGTGHWFRNQHEILMVGVRGNVPAPAQGTQWPSIIRSPKGPHSEKPDWAYELIEQYFPTLGKIELNARRRRDGWTAWGFEAPEETGGQTLDQGEGVEPVHGPLADKSTNTPEESGTAREAPGGSATSNGIAGLSEDPEHSSAGGTVAQSAAVAVEQEVVRPAPHTSIRQDEPVDTAGDGLACLAPAVPETGDGAGAPDTMAADGEGGAIAGTPALPGPLTSEQKNLIIREGYATAPFPGLRILAQRTGLSADAVKQRARTMKLGNPERQRDAARELIGKINEERRAAS